MKTDMKLKFKLRPDMPVGYKANPQYPELPAIVSYLTPFNGNEFQTLEMFQKKVLNDFLGYLRNKKVPEGPDSRLREGLKVESIPERFQIAPGDWWDYTIYTPASNGPGVCVFGGLEKIAS